MHFFKSKLSPDLKVLVKNKLYKSLRVIIHCKLFQEKIEGKIKSYRGHVIHSLPNINCIVANLSPNAIERLLEFPSISYISLDTIAFLCAKSILKSNGCALQSNHKLTGKGITIGLIDSGVYPHADLVNPYNRIKCFIDLINQYKHPYDDNGHGTFISGILCGNGSASKGIYRGVAINSNLYCIKAFDDLGKGYVSDILFSLNKLIEEKDIYNIKVICLPCELHENNEFILSLFSKLFQKAIDNEIVIVVPSGHNGNIECSIRGIATLSNCITVGGIDASSDDLKAYANSSSGPVGKLDKPNLSASCVDICSLNSNINYISERNNRRIYPKSLDDPYITYTGTSCAAAYISGLCALLFESNPDLTFKDVTSLLKISCNMLNISRWIQGAGVIDIEKLLP
ncbi:S8 family serine peptidase [Clostridium peptidivorans]|uniref:S8 family serine peptidase n=1 Tax=Clostridium peptidivorans TaxID=100174 RepID=UPI000BE426D7|nr:S8 family serine peptidase [Clostridium peptidivorans]